MANEQMTPEQFKAVYRRKGWTGRGLADRWAKSGTWISKLGSDPQRDLHWDDAVHGLPELKAGSAKESMPPEQFKSEYRRKGWTGRALAERWGKSEAWISKLGSDPQRDLHWDDAVRGLVYLKDKSTKSS